MRFPVSAGLGVLAISPAAFGVVTYTTDRTAFEATLVSPTVVDFNVPNQEYGLAAAAPGGVDILGMHFQATGTGVANADVEIESQELVLLLGPGYAETVTIDLNETVMAFGAVFISPNTLTGSRLTIAGQMFDFRTMADVPGNGTTFVGFTSDTPFSTLTFTYSDGPNVLERVDFDDFTFGVVPEPTSLALLAAAPLVLRRRR